jgi:hypothetical protein
MGETALVFLGLQGSGVRWRFESLPGTPEKVMGISRS